MKLEASCRIPVFPESQIWFKTMAPWFAQQNSWQMFMLPLGKSKVSTHLEVPKFTLPEMDPLKNFRSRWTSQFSPENIRKWPTHGFFPRSMCTFAGLWRVIPLNHGDPNKPFKGTPWDIFQGQVAWPIHHQPPTTMSTRPKHWLRGGWPDLWVDWCWLHLHETFHRAPDIPIFPDQGAGGRNLDASRTSRPHLAARQGWHRLLPGHGPMGWSLEPWLGSMYWFKGTITRKPHIQWENLWFPVGFPWVSLQPLLWGLGDYEKGHVELWNQRFWHVLTEDSTNLEGSFVGLASNWRLEAQVVEGLHAKLWTRQSCEGLGFQSLSQTQMIFPFHLLVFCGECPAVESELTLQKQLQFLACT